MVIRVVVRVPHEVKDVGEVTDAVDEAVFDLVGVAVIPAVGTGVAVPLIGPEGKPVVNGGRWDSVLVISGDSMLVTPREETAAAYRLDASAAYRLESSAPRLESVSIGDEDKISTRDVLVLEDSA